jgi:CheY-like chemotaxis protein
MCQDIAPNVGIRPGHSNERAGPIAVLSRVDVGQKIRSAPRPSHLPVILFSGKNELPVLAKQAGADDYVEKPARMHALPSG